MKMQEWFELVNFEISEGSDFLWNCYGNNAYCLDSISENYSICVIFDKKTQFVYQVSVHDYVKHKSYRYISPLFIEAYKKEVIEKGIDDNFAYDEVPMIELELEEDFIEKASAIKQGKDYDERILMQITMQEEEMLQLFQLAHKQDITVNQLINNVLKNEIERLQNKI